LDPGVVIGALATAISAIAGVLYREMKLRAERCERDALYWRERALSSTGLAELAVDTAERR
jgi:hypothetical protein